MTDTFIFRTRTSDEDTELAHEEMTIAYEYIQRGGSSKSEEPVEPVYTADFRPLEDSAVLDFALTGDGDF